MPSTAVCPDGHIHLLVPCLDGCGGMHLTNVIVGQIRRQPNLALINIGFENLATATSVEGDAFIEGRDLNLRGCHTGFNVPDGCVQFDLDGIEYRDPAPRRERRKKKKR
jgi:hypothetical protein